MDHYERMTNQERAQLIVAEMPWITADLSTEARTDMAAQIKVAFDAVRWQAGEEAVKAAELYEADVKKDRKVLTDHIATQNDRIEIQSQQLNAFRLGKDVAFFDPRGNIDNLREMLTRVRADADREIERLQEQIRELRAAEMVNR